MFLTDPDGFVNCQMVAGWAGSLGDRLTPHQRRWIADRTAHALGLFLRRFSVERLRSATAWHGAAVPGLRQRPDMTSGVSQQNAIALAGMLPFLAMARRRRLPSYGDDRLPQNPEHAEMLTIDVITLQPLVALIAGLLILIIPRLLNFIVALYLIIIGVIGLLPHLQRYLH